MVLLLSLPVQSSVLQPLYHDLLSRLKVNQHFPSVIISTHETVEGLGLGSMEYEQIVEAINLFVSLYQSPTPSVYLLHDSLELMQVEVGLNSPVLETGYKKYGYLVSQSWIQSLWEATFYCSLTIQVPRYLFWVSSRTNDIPIMKKACSLKIFTSNEI